MQIVTLNRLGQQMPEPLYSVDKPFARAILDAFNALLATEEEIPEAWTKERCWINLRIRRWDKILSLHKRLADFMEMTSQRLQIAEDDEVLIGEVMTCVDTLLKKETEEVQSTIGLISTIVGVAGGVIAVAVALGIG